MSLNIKSIDGWLRYFSFDISIVDCAFSGSSVLLTIEYGNITTTISCQSGLCVYPLITQNSYTEQQVVSETDDMSVRVAEMVYILWALTHSLSLVDR